MPEGQCMPCLLLLWLSSFSSSYSWSWLIFQIFLPICHKQFVQRTAINIKITIASVKAHTFIFRRRRSKLIWIICFECVLSAVQDWQKLNIWMKIDYCDFFRVFFYFYFFFIFEIEYPANFFNDHVRLISRKPLMIKISFSSLRNSAASCNLIFYRSTRFYRKFNPEFMPKHENVLNRNGNNSQHVHCIRSRHQIKWCLENVLQSFIIRDYYSKTHGVCTLKDSLVDDNLSSFSWVLLDDVQITSHAYIHINIGCRAFRVSHLRLFIPAFLNY